MLRTAMLTLMVVLCASCVQAEDTVTENPESPCKVAGCSGQLCVSRDAPPLASTCEWQEAYRCYKEYGECGLTQGGGCGWQLTPELMRCLEEEMHKLIPKDQQVN